MSALSRIVFIAIAAVGTACTEPPPPRLTGMHMQRVDTLYRASLDSLRIATDSVCAREHRERLPLLIDSLLQLRRAEEERLRQRLLENTRGNE